jgi:hypothetical protein
MGLYSMILRGFQSGGQTLRAERQARVILGGKPPQKSLDDSSRPRAAADSSYWRGIVRIPANAKTNIALPQ